MVVETNEKLPQKVKWNQWIAGVGGTLLLVQIGIMAGWSSPYIAQMTTFGVPFRISMNEASWVVSLLNLGRFIGAVVGSTCVNYLGSKTTILATSTPMAFCWILTIVANDVKYLYASRFLGGVSLGMTYSSFSLYLGEIASPSIRGALVSMGMAGLSIGNLIICIMGPYLPMDISGTVSLALCVLLMALFVWLPESPHCLIQKGHTEKAKRSIGFYDPSCDVEAEYVVLKKFVETSNGQTFFESLMEFKKPMIRKALIVTTILFMYSQMCGLNNVLFYMETILRNAKVTVVDPPVIVIIVTACGIAASCLSMFLIDRFGRKFLMCLSSVVVAISLICLGTEFQLLAHGFQPEQLEWLPMFSVILFQAAVFIGVLSVPSAVLGEIFPPNVKCVAACFGSISAGVFAFISTSTYQPLINILHEQYIYWFYAALLLSAVPFVLLCVPETKGKTLLQIQDELMKKG